MEKELPPLKHPVPSDIFDLDLFKSEKKTENKVKQKKAKSNLNSDFSSESDRELLHEIWESICLIQEKLK